MGTFESFHRTSQRFFLEYFTFQPRETGIEYVLLSEKAQHPPQKKKFFFNSFYNIGHSLNKTSVMPPLLPAEASRLWTQWNTADTFSWGARTGRTEMKRVRTTELQRKREGPWRQGEGGPVGAEQTTNPCARRIAWCREPRERLGGNIAWSSYGTANAWDPGRPGNLVVPKALGSRARKVLPPQWEVASLQQSELVLLQAHLPNLKSKSETNKQTNKLYPNS